LLKARCGWSHDQLRRFVAQYVPLDAEVHKVNEADAGTTAYNRLSPIGIETLRRAARELLRSWTKRELAGLCLIRFCCQLSA
jgi:hypothetical protein